MVEEESSSSSSSSSWLQEMNHVTDRLKDIFPREVRHGWLQLMQLSTLLVGAQRSTMSSAGVSALVARRVDFERAELVRLLTEYVETARHPPPLTEYVESPTPAAPPPPVDLPSQQPLTENVEPQLPPLVAQQPPEAAQPVLRPLDQLIRLLPLPSHDASLIIQLQQIRNAYDLNRGHQRVGDEEYDMLLSFVKETEDHDGMLEAILTTMHIIPIERMQSKHISTIVNVIARIAAPLACNRDQRMFNSARDRLLALCHIITRLCHNGPTSTRTLMVTSRIAKHLMSILVASSTHCDPRVLESLSAMSIALDLDNPAMFAADLLPADVTRKLLGSLFGIIKSCIPRPCWVNVVEAAADFLEKLTRTFARTMATLAASEDLVQALCDIVSKSHHVPQIRRILSPVFSSMISDEGASNFPQDGQLAKSLMAAVAHVARWSAMATVFGMQTIQYTLNPYSLHCHTFNTTPPTPSRSVRTLR